MTGAEHLAQTAGHAVVGCFSTSIAGGSCGSGAASAGFAAAAGPLLPGADISPERFFARVIVGGTASRLAGGSFANGATSAAFAYLFNDVAGARDADARADGACGGKGAMTPSNACYAARQAAAKEWADVPRSQTLQVSTPELEVIGAFGALRSIVGAVGGFIRSLTVSQSLSLPDVVISTGHWATRAERYGYDVSAINKAIVSDVTAMAPNLSRGAWFMGQVEVGGSLFRYSAMPIGREVRVTTVYSPGKW
jgi:hypothetical protein